MSDDSQRLKLKKSSIAQSHAVNNYREVNVKTNAKLCSIITNRNIHKK